MASSKRFTAEQALEQLLESDEEKSGADSFYADGEALLCSLACLGLFVKKLFIVLYTFD